RLTAQLVPDFDNRSLFDHEYDHFPAMTLLEGAARPGWPVRPGTGSSPRSTYSATSVRYG
ncbi:hypothetical protein ABZ813_18225, partial [Streptomyces sp. NPDC047434]